MTTSMLRTGDDEYGDQEEEDYHDHEHEHESVYTTTNTISRLMRVNDDIYDDIVNDVSSIRSTYCKTKANVCPLDEVIAFIHIHTCPAR